MITRDEWHTCDKCKYFCKTHELHDGTRCPKCKAALIAEDEEAVAQRVRDAFARAITGRWGP